MPVDAKPKGALYRCPVCGAEIILLAPCPGYFEPHCCNRPMLQQPRQIKFYRCDVCQAEIAVLKEKYGEFAPRCCGHPM
ncbi:MAG: hypothetical protein LC725_02765, partial [Lentisphaerae bacterium]|nr:hypothetical protein [Lentisphaerota bacterium]